jgi:hypothetical protein
MGHRRYSYEESFSIPEALFSLPLLLTHVSDSILPPLPICKTMALLDVFMCPYLFADMAEKFHDIFKMVMTRPF